MNYELFLYFEIIIKIVKKFWKILIQFFFTKFEKGEVTKFFKK